MWWWQIAHVSPLFVPYLHFNDIFSGEQNSFFPSGFTPNLHNYFSCHALIKTLKQKKMHIKAYISVTRLFKVCTVLINLMRSEIRVQETVKKVCYYNAEFSSSSYYSHKCTSIQTRRLINKSEAFIRSLNSSTRSLRRNVKNFNWKTVLSAMYLRVHIKK